MPANKPRFEATPQLNDAAHDQRWLPPRISPLHLQALSNHLDAKGVRRGILHLGGGSVLAAAWDHRKSTDIDLWIAPERASELTSLAPDAAAWRTLFHPPGHQVTVQDATRENTSVTFELDGVPVSVFTSHYASHRNSRHQMMRGTIFAAANTSEILSGKLLGRWAEQARDKIPIRDLYDLVVARTVEPQAVLRTFRSMSDSARTQAASRLRSLPDDWYQHDPKPIIDPKFNVGLHALGQRLSHPFESGDWQAIPAAYRGDARDGRASEPGFQR